jgi:prephenate dehydratase
MTQQIAIQGGAGSFSHMATLKIFPNSPQIKFCATFEEAFLLATQKSEINLVCPCENTVAGRVPEFHSLLRRYSLQIYAEHFEKISHNLLAVKGATLDSIKNVHSHIHALGQCRRMILNHKLKEVIESDTAFSARYVSTKGDKTEAAIASKLAAQTYGLQILKSKVEDEPGANVTRFLVMGKESRHPEFIKEKHFLTSCIFQLKSIPSALYKCLGSFSGYGINLCRLESFSLKNTFEQVAFYIEIEKHIEDPIMQKALEELGFHCETLTILGCYPASSYRLNS